MTTILLMLNNINQSINQYIESMMMMIINIIYKYTKMNNTYSKIGLNPSSYELYQSFKQEFKPIKNTLMISNSKNAIKKAFLSRMNNPEELKTLYSNYSKFPSLSNSHSTLKITKGSSNSRLSCQSYFQMLNNKVSPSPSQNIININRMYNEKSMSTMQSIDDRKEIIKLKGELKEKNDIIQALNKTIETYIKDRKEASKELEAINSQLLASANENAKLMQEIKKLQLSYNKLKQSINSNTNTNKSSYHPKKFKLTEIMELINKEEINNNNINETDEEFKFEDQSLSDICFTDKVKMEKTISISDNGLPTLNFDLIGNKNNKKDNNAFGDEVEANKPKFKSIENINEDISPKYVSKNNSAIIGSYKKQKITFSKTRTVKRK